MVVQEANVANFKSVGEFSRAVDAMERDLKAKHRQMGVDMAQKLRPEAYRAAAADLGGDPKFSGWRPWLELQIKPKAYGAALIPTRSSAGPWTVAERGRNQGNASGFSGPGINRRTGITSRTKSGNLRKVRAVRARRWNGYTEGKNTATDATARIDGLVDGVAEKHLKVVIKRHLD